MMERDISGKSELKTKARRRGQVCPQLSVFHSQEASAEGLNSVARLCKDKKIHSDAVETFQQCNLKPRYSSESLSRLMQDQVVRVMQKYMLDMPIEYLESLLYSSTRVYVETLPGFPISLGSLPDIHQIYSLKQQEQVLSVSESERLNQNLELLIEGKPTAFEEYKLIKGLVDLTAGLIIHWGLYRRENYEYRRQARVLNVSTLDLVAINSKLQSMDTLWLAASANTLPMSEFISETAKQLALVVMSATEKTFRFMLKMNSTDFRTQTSIDNYLVSKQPRLRKFLHAEARYFSSPPTYQELSLPTGFVTKCFNTHSTRSLLKLRGLLVEQETAFRAFEETVLANFVCTE